MFLGNPFIFVFLKNFQQASQSLDELQQALHDLTARVNGPDTTAMEQQADTIQ